MTTKAEALAAFDRVVEAGLARQAARSPREAALAALGPQATDAEVEGWLAAHRPDAVRSAS